MHVCNIWDNDLTEYQVWFYKLIEKALKKPLDIFSPQIERKRSKEYLVIILAVKESFEPRVYLWKKQTPGSWLKT